MVLRNKEETIAVAEKSDIVQRAKIEVASCMMPVLPIQPTIFVLFRTKQYSSPLPGDRAATGSRKKTTGTSPKYLSFVVIGNLIFATQSEQLDDRTTALHMLQSQVELHIEEVSLLLDQLPTPHHVNRMPPVVLVLYYFYESFFGNAFPSFFEIPFF